MTNEQILRIAMEQSAIDLSCRPSDFLAEKNVIVHSGKAPDCRKYLELPFFCNLVSYGGNLVASIDPQIEEIVKAYIGKYPVEHCFETPNFHVLNDALSPYGMRICFMAEYFLPDLEYLTERPDFSSSYSGGLRRSLHKGMEQCSLRKAKRA